MTDIEVGKTAPRPGWPELAVALVVYLLCLILIVLWIVQIPDAQAAFRGIIGNAANGVAGVVAFLAAVALRIRNLRAFGFRATSRKWLLVAVAAGIAGFGLSFVVEAVYFSFVTEVNTQADFQAAARGGVLSLLALLITGALFTPVGEELVFRGVIANALIRHGIWIAVIGSAAIFGIVHGLSVITLLAFMIGIVTGFLFYRTRSLWPCFVVHIVYNGLHLLYYATL